MIDHFTKCAEAVPCITASAEETCDHLINTCIERHGCSMTLQSENGTAFVGELTKELMRRSQKAQVHSTTYHPQTNSLVERQNRTLVSMLRVYCSRYMTDWDRYLPQVMGAYNSMQHSTIEADKETSPYAEEDWQDPEQKIVPKTLVPDLPCAIQTRSSDRTRLTKKNNPYEDDFVVDRIDLKKIA